MVSLAGFTFAIWQIMRAKSLAEQLKTAVNDLRNQLERKTAATRLNELIRDLEEVKEFSRAEISALSQKRFTAIRLKLIDIRHSFGGWSAEQQIVIQKSITQFSNIERLLDSALKGNQIGPKGLSKKLNQQIDKLATLLAVVQNEGGRRL